MVLEVKADDMLTLLKSKGIVPPQIETAIRGQTDINVLKRWLLLTADMKSAEEFERQSEGRYLNS